MTEWKIGLVVAPILIASMAMLLYRQRAISRATLTIALLATGAITAVLFST
ncbi:MAG: hypothetical protein JNK46_08460 [Methylobacteriaceae bacterium]|nr:hypothetical protein [Methylobacteriaceae bacterium]